jgi:hypothetical protein
MRRFPRRWTQVPEKVDMDVSQSDGMDSSMTRKRPNSDAASSFQKKKKGMQSVDPLKFDRTRLKFEYVKPKPGASEAVQRFITLYDYTGTGKHERLVRNRTVPAYSPFGMSEYDGEKDADEAKAKPAGERKPKLRMGLGAPGVTIELDENDMPKLVDGKPVYVFPEDTPEEIKAMYAMNDDIDNEFFKQLPALAKACNIILDKPNLKLKHRTVRSHKSKKTGLRSNYVVSTESWPWTICMDEDGQKLSVEEFTKISKDTHSVGKEYVGNYSIFQGAEVSGCDLMLEILVMENGKDPKVKEVREVDYDDYPEEIRAKLLAKKKRADEEQREKKTDAR